MAGVGRRRREGFFIKSEMGTREVRIWRRIGRIFLCLENRGHTVLLISPSKFPCPRISPNGEKCGEIRRRSSSLSSRGGSGERKSPAFLVSPPQNLASEIIYACPPQPRRRWNARGKIDSCQYIIPLFCRYSANGAKALSPSSGPATENDTDHTRLVMYMKFCKNKPVMGYSPRRRSPAR